jgi:hypothetical protein
MREQWLNAALGTGRLTTSQVDRLAHHWRHGGKIESNSADGLDQLTLSGIVDAVGPCPWICEVHVFGHTQGRSREKALLAARIALAAISLAWVKPSQQGKRNGTGLFYDMGPAHSRHTIMFRDGSYAGASHESVLRLGRFLTMGDAPAFVARSERNLETVGVALETFLATNPSGRRPLLEEALCRSLIWFGEACNEPLDFMAIVKFGAALDTLAKGKKARGMCELIQRRYPLDDLDAPFLLDGTSARPLVEQIYDTGRSRIVHGTRSSLVEDLEELRARAEFLAATVLRASIHWLRT